MIQDNPTAMAQCFVRNLRKELQLDDLLDIMKAEFSEIGSNKCKAEIDIYKSFTAFLEQCAFDETSPLNLENVLMFITGTEVIPPLGFHKEISVKFLHSCAPDCMCLPTVATCALDLNLPIHYKNEEVFSTIMTNSIQMCQGYGN